MFWKHSLIKITKECQFRIFPNGGSTKENIKQKIPDNYIKFSNFFAYHIVKIVLFKKITIKNITKTGSISFSTFQKS